MAGKLQGAAIQSGTITTTQLSSSLNSTITAGGGPKITSIRYPGDDTAANTVGGQTIYILGSGFKSNSTIYINGNNVPSVSYISASNLSFTGPALSAATYPVYVINPEDGATAILVPGFQVSGEPTWVTSATLSEQDALSAWNVSLSATGDGTITYALKSGSTLPSGISLASNGVISGTMSSPPESDTTYNFTVIATDSQNQDAERAFSVTASAGEGVVFANNVLLIHADGTNNQNNHTFLDSSNNNLTITRSGNATQGSFSPFSQTGWSNYFDGTGDNLTLSRNVALLPASNTDFTMEAWIYLSSYNTSQSSQIMGLRERGVSQSWILYANSSGTLFFEIGPTPTFSLSSSSNTIPLNTWKHVAVTRNGTSANNVKLFIDGVQVGQGSTNISTADSDTNVFSIGADQDGDEDNLTGYISNLRIVNGTAVYTSNFTRPTTPLTAVANTSLLTCQSNRFVDNSTNAFTLSRNGGVSIKPFSPFAATAVYTTANVGGSVYLDGTGDWLSISNNHVLDVTQGDFTIETWVYPTGGGDKEIYNYRTNAPVAAGTLLRIWANGEVVLSYVGGSSIRSRSNIAPQNAWTHIAVTRSGSTARMFINGVSANSVSLSNGTTPNTTFYIGRDEDAGQVYTGYLSNYRIVKGTAVYTSNFTPPTAPLTNIANTSLLCNFTNAGIFDQTAKNVLETVGDAKVSTAQYKYGNASMYFDGTGDYCRTQSSELLGFGSGDYTVECWVYAPSYSTSYMLIFDNRSGGEGIGLYAGGEGFDANKVVFANNSAIRFSTNTSLTPNTWSHIACVRYNNNVSIYINGTNAGANASSNTLDSRVYASSTSVYVGASSSAIQLYTGYIDDLRITKGYARYTANFTAPTAAFKNK